jgi:hypothetical protein
MEKRFRVDSLGGEAIIYVRDGYNSGRKWDLLSLKPIRITRPIPFFVVIIGHFFSKSKKRLGTNLSFNILRGDIFIIIWLLRHFFSYNFCILSDAFKMKTCIIITIFGKFCEGQDCN